MLMEKVEKAEAHLQQPLQTEGAAAPLRPPAAVQRQATTAPCPSWSSASSAGTTAEEQSLEAGALPPTPPHHDHHYCSRLDQICPDTVAAALRTSSGPLTEKLGVPRSLECRLGRSSPSTPGDRCSPLAAGTSAGGQYQTQEGSEEHRGSCGSVWALTCAPLMCAMNPARPPLDAGSEGPAASTLASMETPKLYA